MRTKIRIKNEVLTKKIAENDRRPTHIIRASPRREAQKHLREIQGATGKASWSEALPLHAPYQHRVQHDGSWNPPYPGETRIV